MAVWVKRLIGMKSHHLSGSSNSFAIQWQIAKAHKQPSLMGLGHFCILLHGKKFGVDRPDATMLACSYDSVARRLKSRGQHEAPFAEENSNDIVSAVVSSYYHNVEPSTLYLGLEAAELNTLVRQRELLWAPDGDEAFDDGGHVLHFDVGEKVRLLGFINHDDNREIFASISDITIESDTFYHILEKWLTDFQSVRESLLGEF